MLFPAFFCVSLKILETSGMADFHEICHPLKLPKSQKRETINSLADALYNQARFLKLKGSETDRSALGAEQQV